jgi:hypothetical protein
VASTAKLYETLAQFYFRAKNKWQADGKAIIQYLKKENYGRSGTVTRNYKEGPSKKSWMKNLSKVSLRYREKSLNLMNKKLLWRPRSKEKLQ